MSELELNDIQGLVTTGYGHLDYAAYVVIRFGTDAKRSREWLAAIADEVSSAKPWPKDASGKTIKPDHAIAIGLTYHGLKALALPDSALESFPEDFRAGMADPQRSRILGDTGESAPKHWDFGGDADAFHVLLVILTGTEAFRGELIQLHTSRAALHGASVTGQLLAQRLPDSKEHFGWVDGIAHPIIRSSPRTSDVSDARIAAGEFVMGYTNQYGNIPAAPRLNGEDIGKNGTYLVFRKLHQDVAAFWKFVAEQAELLMGNDSRTPQERQLWLASKMVGRWPSGVPLTLSPERDDPAFDRKQINTFLYRERDEHGDYTPLGSHIRRANPRDSHGPTGKSALEMADRHLILRRGMTYGEALFPLNQLPPEPLTNDSAERGLAFLCVNANIAQQFEFVQQTWLNNTKFHGLYTDKDPISGDNDGQYTHTIQRDPLRKQITAVPRFVTVKGGAYCFMPGLSALKRLASF